MATVSGRARAAAYTAADSAPWLVREPPEAYGVGEPAAASVPGATADPEPLTPDELDEVADEITILSAHIHAATGRLNRLVARFDRAGGWMPGGHESCANWLSLNAGFDLHTARELVRVARALEELPESGAAMARGALSFDQARVLTRVARPETEADLLELAENSAPSTFQRTCRAWKRDSRQDEAAREERRHLSRRLHLFPNDDGMFKLIAILSPEAAANTQVLIDQNYFELYERDRGVGGDPLQETPEERARRRADAFGLGIERALAGLGGSGGWAKDAASDPASDRTLSGLRAERYKVMLHVDADTLSAGREPGLSELADGTRLAAETARRLACDCSLVRVTRDAKDGTILGVGRSTRSIPTAIRRALHVRDRFCRFPGCSNRFADGHHVVHWADGGETSLANTMLLCRFHHRLVHEGGWRVQWWGRAKTPVFLDPKGQAHARLKQRKPPPLPPDPDRDLRRANRANGAEPDALTAAAPWQRERDVPDEVLFRALEAVAPD